MNSNRSLVSGLILLVLVTLSLGTLWAQAPSAAFVNKTVPLAQHPQGQQMMATAAKDAAMVDINFKFLDKEYENDVWVKEPITGKKARVSCLRFKAVSGFRMRIDPPKFQLSMQGLTINENIARLSAQGVKVKFQVGPCVEHATGMGFSASDISFVFKARPALTFDGKGLCRFALHPDPTDIRVKIGGLNITGVQNDLDKLVKDAVREGLNFTLNGTFPGLISTALGKVAVDFCGRGVSISNK